MRAKNKKSDDYVEYKTCEACGGIWAHGFCNCELISKVHCECDKCLHKESVVATYNYVFKEFSVTAHRVPSNRYRYSRSYIIELRHRKKLFNRYECGPLIITRHLGCELTWLDMATGEHADNDTSEMLRRAWWEVYLRIAD